MSRVLIALLGLGLIGSPAHGITLTQVTTDPGTDLHPSWTPDGQTLVFESNRSGTRQLYKIPATGGVAQQITTSSQHNDHPEVSPDGTYIAFRKRVGSAQHIYRIGINGGAETALTSGLIEDWGPTFSPDGGTIYFARKYNLDEWDIFKVPAAGGPTQIVMSAPDYHGYPSVSPDGLWIAVEGGPFAGVDINIFEFEVANPSNIRQVSFETANTGQPAYKTNGSRVGGVSRRLNNHLDLYEWDRTSLGHARVTFDAEEIADAGSVFPAYSPDGTKVAFASKRVTGDYNIWVLDISEQPIPVDLLSFQVSSTDDGVLVSWRSAGDASDVAGYHVHKGPEVGHLERLTTSILSGGPEYRFLDPAATMPGTKYWLEEISRSGSRAWYGPRELKEFVLPVVHALRAFPNPFHGSVEILYNSPASQDIQVALFDMSGRQVSRLFDGTVSGELRLAWNGRSDSGEALPAGVYFARVTGDVSTTTLKVLKLE